MTMIQTNPDGDGFIDTATGPDLCRLNKLLNKLPGIH